MHGKDREKKQGRIDGLMRTGQAFLLQIRTLDGQTYGPAGYIKTEDDRLVVSDYEGSQEPYHVEWSDIGALYIEVLD